MDRPPQQPWQPVNPPRLPRFTGDGDGCDAEDFISEAKRILRHHPMHDGTAVEWVIQSLEGCARREITGQPADSIANAQQILDTLLRVFGEQRSFIALQAALFTRRQGLRETVIDYAQSIQRLAEKVNRLSANSVSAIVMRDCFVEGLYPPSLRRDVRRLVRDKGDTTLMEARDEALRWAREDSEDQEASLAQVAASIPLINQEVEALRAQVDQLVQSNEQLRRQIMMQQRPVGQQSKPQSSHPDHPLTCGWCNQQGHREADRQAKQRTSQRQQKGRNQRSRRSSRQQATGVTTRGGPKGKFSPALVMVQETTAHHKQGRDAARRKHRKVVCWWCRRQGHIQSECRLKQRTRHRHPNALNPPPKHPVPSTSNPRKPVGPANTHNCQEKDRKRRCPAVVGRQPHAVSQVGVVQPLAGGSERTVNRCDLLPAKAPRPPANARPEAPTAMQPDGRHQPRLQYPERGEIWLCRPAAKVEAAPRAAADQLPQHWPEPPVTTMPETPTVRRSQRVTKGLHPTVQNLPRSVAR